MASELDDEVEIKIEFYDTCEKDPLSEKCILASEIENLLEPKSIGSSFSNEVTGPSISLDKIESLEHATWHKNQDHLGRYLCKFCDLSYLSIQTLRNHVKIKHPKEAETLKTTMVKNKRNSKLKCHICNKRYKVLSDLKGHVSETHERELVKFSCHFCNAAFLNSTEINDHLYLKHKMDTTRTKINYCSICGYRTIKRSHFTQHLNSHVQQKTFKCKLCDYASDRIGNVRMHERIHLNLKPYCCNHQNCNYKSAAKSALKSHQLKHRREENMLYCDKCSYKTVYSQSLKKHCDSHVGKLLGLSEK